MTPNCSGCLADRRMHRAREAMEKTRLDAARCEKLTNVFQRVDGVVHRLGWKTVHQVSVNQNSSVRERPGDSRHLLDGHAFFHQREQPV